jgi:Zn-dependent protease/CBS domain-containing protein
VHSQIKLGRIAGIEIGLHYSWFLIAILIAFSLAGHFHSVRPSWNPAVDWTVAIITALFFFVTLLLHELAHSILAKSRGLKVREITLFALGGVSQIESEASDAKSEFWIAIVGPLTSLVIGGLCVLAARLSGSMVNTEPNNPTFAVLLWLGYINLALAGFNMIPGYPLDGGRVLRAIAWWITGQMDRATRIAARVGQVVAFLFILDGVYQFFVGASFGGLWMAFIGWFLLDASRSSYLQVELMSGLRNRRVADLMERNCTEVEGYLSVRDFIDEYVLHSAGRCFIVAQDHTAKGIITPNDIKKVGRDQWEQTSLQSVMRPLTELRTVPPDMPAVKALELMGREQLSELAVARDGNLQGIFSRDQVLRFLQLHAGASPESTAKRAA